MLIWGERHKHPVYSNELEIFLKKKKKKKKPSVLVAFMQSVCSDPLFC